MTQEEQILIRGKCFLYRQKAPFVPSGKSVYGALEYNEERDEVRCHECGEWFRMLGYHIRKMHTVLPLEYRLRHGLNRNAGLCGVQAGLSIAARGGRRLSKAEFEVIRQKGIKAAAEARRKRELEPHRLSPEVGDLHYEQRNERGRCDAQLFAALHALAVQCGHTPTRKDLDRAGIHATSACAAFNVGTMSDLFSLVGLRPNSSGSPGHITPPGLKREELIEIIRDFNANFGRPPKAKDARGGVLPTAKVFARVFGSFNVAIQTAGFDVRHIFYSREMLINKMREFYEQHGQAPRRSRKYGGRLPAGFPTHKVFLRVFGSMAAAYEAAGIPEERKAA